MSSKISEIFQVWSLVAPAKDDCELHVDDRCGKRTNDVNHLCQVLLFFKDRTDSLDASSRTSGLGSGIRSWNKESQKFQTR